MLYRFSKIMLVAAALAAILGSSPAVADDIAVKQAWSRAQSRGRLPHHREPGATARPIAFGIE
jgi:hypothetical protein